MLEKIIAQTLQKKSIAVFFVILIIIAGLYSYITLPVDAFPDVTNIQVEVVSYAKGLSAVEIERAVTTPVEMSMRGLPKVKQLRSVTKFGLSIVTIVFEDNVDIYFARQLVFERLSEAKERVPQGVEISLGPIATAMGEIFQYTLQGEMPNSPKEKTDYLTNLRIIEEWIVSPQFKRIAGVNEVNSFGGYFKEYQVITAPNLLAKYNISVEDVFTAIEKNNQNVGGNTLTHSSEQYIVRGIGLLKDTTSISNIVLKSSDGVPILVKDVAEIKIGQAVRQGASLLNGSEETVGGIVMMLRGENSKEVVTRVAKKVEEINSSGALPEGITIVPYYNRAQIINDSMYTVNKALLEGAVLVLIIIYLLLRSFRGSIVVLIGLPLSLLLTILLMKILGLSANLMSLGGLAISIGMIIDATIIQVENVQRHLSENISEPKLRTVLSAVLEVRKPSIYGELIIAITFIPILSLEGIEGKMFAPLALTVAIAILSSLAVSIFIIPTLAGLILKPQPEKESVIVLFIQKYYSPLIDVAFQHKKKIIATAIGVLVAAIAVIPFLGSEFIPIMDEGAFDMDVSLLPSVSIDESIKANSLVGQKLIMFPELKTVVSRIGQTGVALDARGVDKAGYVGILNSRNKWPIQKTRDELIEEMRDSLSTIPGIAFSFSQPIQCRIDELVAGTKAQLIIKLFGDNIDVLNSKASEIAHVVKGIDGAADVIPEKASGQPYLNIEIDRAKIARYGMNISDVQKIIEIAIAGKAATQLFEENKSFDITVRFPETLRNSINSIGNVLIPLPGGGNIPLSQVSTIRQQDGPLQVSREDGMRRIGIEVNISGRDIGSFVSEAQKLIKANVTLPTGYLISWGGQFENQQRAMNRLMFVGPVAIGLIFLLLFFTFRNIRMALLVISILPFSLIGGVFALLISGLYLSVPAAVGFVVLFGVAVLNGVVLVSYIIQLREKGYDQAKAIKSAALQRLRPVLMTASIAIFSLVPMLIASGTGSEIQKPLAVVVVGGLLSSTILTLIIIPIIFPWFESDEACYEI